MSNIDQIGKVSATERDANSCDEFLFWIKDGIMLRPFDIVKVYNTQDASKTYGVIQDIFHITDSPGHISNYVSSDFGDVAATPLTTRLALSYAKVAVLHNDNENYMPLLEGMSVYTCDADDIKIALGLNEINKKWAIPAGLLKSSNNVTVPIDFSGEFLIGPEGAHFNISGISGLATKTSYVMFLLKAIQEKLCNEVAIIVLNVKVDDLLRIDAPNTKLTDTRKDEWGALGIACEPFKNVSYYYPYAKNHKSYSNSTLSLSTLEEQHKTGKAYNYIYTFNHDFTKIDMLFSNIDDPNFYH